MLGRTLLPIWNWLDCCCLLKLLEMESWGMFGLIAQPSSCLNKGASRCHRRTFLSKWFHKEPLTSEELFCFTKVFLWRNKVLQIIKRYERYGSLKNLWLNGSLWNQKWFFNWIAVQNFLSTFIFKRKEEMLLQVDGREHWCFWLKIRMEHTF